MALSLVTAPTSEPVGLAEIKDHLRIDGDAEDNLLNVCIRAARIYAETYLRRQLVTATWRLTLDCFPCWTIEVPLPPLVSVATLTYLDTGGVSTVLTENTHFIKDIYSEPGRITPAYGTNWPATRGVLNSVTLTYVAGYGTAEDVPETIRYGIKLLIAEMYDKREPTVVGSIINAVPALNTLLGSESYGSYV